VQLLSWFVYVTLNRGLLLRVIIEPLHTLHLALRSGWALALPALLQVLAIWVFVAAIWQRVKATKSQEQSIDRKSTFDHNRFVHCAQKEEGCVVSQPTYDPHHAVWVALGYTIGGLLLNKGLSMLL
jgi:hypothetical protein